MSAPRRSADGGGSRHLTANEHWKSQIRHALYTSPRFARAEEGEDDWRVSNLDAPAPATTTVRVYPADEPKAGPAKPRGRPRKRVPGSDAAVAVAAGPERRIEESKDVRKKSIQVSNTKAPVVVPVPRVGPRPDPVARPPPLDARVGPPLGLAASASAANLAKPVARVRDDDEHAGAGAAERGAFSSAVANGRRGGGDVTSSLEEDASLGGESNAASSFSFPAAACSSSSRTRATGFARFAADADAASPTRASRGGGRETGPGRGPGSTATEAVAFFPKRPNLRAVSSSMNRSGPSREAEASEPGLRLRGLPRGFAEPTLGSSAG